MSSQSGMTWLLYRELETAANPDVKRTALEQTYGDFYAACMNTELADQKGVRALQPVLDTINGLSDRSSWLRCWERLKYRMAPADFSASASARARRTPHGKSHKPARVVSACRTAITTVAEPSATEDSRWIRGSHGQDVPTGRGHARESR